MRGWIVLILLLLAPGAGGCGAGAAGPASPDIRFRETALAAGIDFRLGHQGRSPLTILETFGSGCAFLDVNQDGHLDALLLGPGVCRLYTGNGRGRFAEETARYGLDRLKGHWTGCAAGDIDNDGWPDLYLTGYRSGALVMNKEGAGFRDETVSRGAGNLGWGSSAGFADLDGDGDLDLVLGRYLEFGPDDPQYCAEPSGVRHACAPGTYRPQRARLLRNDGRGNFSDITRQAGMARSEGKVMGLAFCDYNDDGRIDFYLANDTVPCELWRNLGGLRFADAGAMSGVAFGPTGLVQAGMGVHWADADRNGWFDLMVSTFADEPFSLYLQEEGLFRNATNSVGLGDATRAALGFGARFADLDNDGWPDLVLANGHVNDTIEQYNPNQRFRQTVQIIRNGGGWFVDVSGSAGEDLKTPIVGRGLATGDYDRDGRIDFLVVDGEGRARLFHNETARTGHWIRIRLRGGRSNRFGYGARITARAGGSVWISSLDPSGSYLSSSEACAQFGVGEAAQLDELEVRWPGGKTQRLRNVATNREWLIAEPAE